MNKSNLERRKMQCTMEYCFFLKTVNTLKTVEIEYNKHSTTPALPRKLLSLEFNTLKLTGRSSV